MVTYWYEFEINSKFPTQYVVRNSDFIRPIIEQENGIILQEWSFSKNRSFEDTTKFSSIFTLAIRYSIEFYSCK